MGKAKILIVEDEGITATSLKTTLRYFGYQVCELISTGEEAVKSVEEEKPDLVIMDILLAGKMDGIEAAKKIRSRHDMPILFLTGYSDAEILEKIRGIEYSTLVTKPTNPDEIAVAIDQALNTFLAKNSEKESIVNSS